MRPATIRAELGWITIFVASCATNPTSSSHDGQREGSVHAPERTSPRTPSIAVELPEALRGALRADRHALRREDRGFRRVPPKLESARTRVDAELPLTAAGELRIVDRATQVALEARLLDSREIEGELLDGHAVYRKAGPDQSTVLQAITDEGLEDYLLLEHAPSAGEVTYEVALSQRVAGLRLVGNTLEALDASGGPRLRIAPPFIVGADGKRTEVALHVSACEVDRNPAPPWGRAPVDPGSRACRVHLRWQDSGVQYPALLDPAWTSTESMIEPRTEHTATVIGENVLVVGGISGAAPGVVLASAEVYSMVDQSWASAGTIVTPRARHTATPLDDSVLLAGGVSSTSPSETVSDTAQRLFYSGELRSVGTMSARRQRATATLLNDGKVLIAGGHDGAAALDNADIFNPGTDTWSSGGDLEWGRDEHAAILLSRSKHVLIVGLKHLDQPSAQLYNPGTNTWSAASEPSVPRSRATLTELPDGRVLYAGGYTESSVASGTAEIYDPSANTWTRTGSLSYGRAGHTALRMPNDRVLVTGGDENADLDSHVELYNPEWGTWAPMPSLPAKRTGHSTWLNNDGSVTVAGGTSMGVPTATVESLVVPGVDTHMSEYSFPGAAGEPAQIQASLHRPLTLLEGKAYPLIVFVHASSQSCGDGDHHRGFMYIADELASREYIAISINRSQGPGNCANGLIPKNIVLTHLKYLSAWNGGTTPPAPIDVSLAGHIDFQQVGLVGHSNGWTIVTDALTKYRAAGSPWPAQIGTVNFQGLFEIAGGNVPATTLYDVKLVILHPMCGGGDERVWLFDRMMNSSFSETTPSFKATYTVWGADHFHFNTEQPFFGDVCYPGGPDGQRPLAPQEQLQTGFYSMLSFFLANVGTTADGELNRTFDPRFPGVADRVDRGFSPGAAPAKNLRLEDFDQDAGVNSGGSANEASGIVMSHGPVPRHDPALRGGNIQWDAGGPTTYFQSNWGSKNLTSYQFLDLRLARVDDPEHNADPETTFSVAMVKSDGGLTNSVDIDDYVTLDGPVGRGEADAGVYTPILQTARIPFSHFPSLQPSVVHGVRFQFTGSPKGHIVVANIRATTAD